MKLCLLLVIRCQSTIKITDKAKDDDGSQSPHLKKGSRSRSPSASKSRSRSRSRSSSRSKSGSRSRSGSRSSRRSSKSRSRSKSRSGSRSRSHSKSVSRKGTVLVAKNFDKIKTIIIFQIITGVEINRLQVTF